MKRGVKTAIVAIVALLVVGVGVAYYLYDRWANRAGYNIGAEQAVRLYVYPGMDWDAVADSIECRMDAPLVNDLRWLFKQRAKEQKPIVGAYLVEPDMTTRALYNRLFYGMDSPINLTFNSARLPGMLWKRMSRQLLIDSAQIAQAMVDATLLRRFEVPDTTLAYYIIPNTYEVYWDITPAELVERLAKESKKFWTEERLAQAEHIGLSPYEVITLAAIVQEESAKSDEYPEIAGLYLNRLRMGMRLQADPTVKFALQDFALKRILHSHLRVDSPYNTYLYAGLPAGPIRIPSIQAIDGVLNATDHKYIYMCAKHDFSGYHAFAETYSKHLENARRYTRALDERGIK